MKRTTIGTVVTALGLMACGGGDPAGNSTEGAGGSGAGTTNGSGPTGSGSGGGNTASCDGFAEEAFADGTTDYVGGVSVTTLAGSADSGNLDGNGSTAAFNNPVSVLADNDSLLVTDYNNHQIRRVTESGEVTTFMTDVDGFFRPFGLTFGADTLYVQTDWNTEGDTDFSNGSIWKVDPISGSATPWLEDVNRNRGLAWLDGKLYAATVDRNVIRTGAPDATELGNVAGEWDCANFADGNGTEARFELPYGMAVGASGDLLVADWGNHAIRRVTPDGVVTTITGNGSPGMNDGALADARFYNPIDVAVDASGRIYVSDLGNQRIRLIDEGAGTVSTIAGTGARGFADGNGDAAEFYGQEGIAVTPDGMTIYLADGTQGEDGQPYNRVRVITR